ncbi:MAG: GPO family capsid scaffolding protein [Gammaproteobacteria bacterium]|nr:GPO family capsid scaffolding protein [Gammaproteobacteria bacterium]
MKLKTKFTRVAVEGDTIDGREITREQIQQMADSYNPKRYAARIWPEHFRGLIPGGPFDALGDVTALKAEEISDVDELKGKLALYAQMEPTEQLIKMNKASQKVFTSIEMITNFAKSNEAYMVGLAVTDTPASQGTEMLAFGGETGDVIAGAEHAAVLEMETESTEEEAGKPSLFKRVMEAMSKKERSDDERFSDINSAVEEIAKFATELESRLSDSEEASNPSTEAFDALKSEHESLKEQFTQLMEKLSATEDGNHSDRPAADGGSGQAVADC